MQLSSPSRPSSISSRAYTPTPISPIPGALTSNGQVRITYTLGQSLQSSPHFAVLLESLRSRLQPLRNLHWRPSAGTLPGSSIRTIQSVDVELIPLDLGTSTARLSTADGFAGDEGGRSQIPGTVLAKPFINIWLGMCEDADTYKNVIRRQLKDWVASVTTHSRREQEWLIVLVNMSSPGKDAAKSSGKRLFQMKGSVIDQMRADFTLAKRDRCVQLNYTTGGQDDPAAWTELIAKIKDAIIDTLDSRIAERMDDVRRTEAQRAVPGWNFCTFFVLKESIAESFEGMTLVDAALLQYSELEASFYQVLKEKNLSWFGKLGGTTPGDDAAPLLSVTKKPYRDLILSNTISVFDFRCYLLARQCLLLAKMGAVADVASKAVRFIGTFSRTLRENENSLSEPFLESWIYSSALDIVDECDGWLANIGAQESMLDAKGSSYSASKCELLDLARAQLDKIGIRAGHLLRAPPFSTSIPEQTPTSRPGFELYDPHSATLNPNVEEHRRLSRLGVTNSNILEAMDDAAAFDRLYKALIMRGINTCESNGRLRTATRLRGILAALHLHRGEISEAQSIYSELPSSYTEQNWTVLESYMRAQHLGTSKGPGEIPTEEWIARAFALVKADLFLSKGARQAADSDRIQKTLERVLEAADSLSTVLPMDGFSPVDVRLSSGVTRLDNLRDGSYLDIITNNKFPEAVEVHCINVVVKGRDGVTLKFEHPTTKLSSGESALSLFCPDPMSGLFVTSQFEYQISKLLFRVLSSDSTKPVSSTKPFLSEARVAVRVTENTRAVQITMQMPRHIVLGDQRVLFKVFTGRSALGSGTISVMQQTSEVRYALESAEVLGDAQGSIKCAKDRIVIEGLPSDYELVLSVPFFGSPRNDELEATLSLEYRSAAQPEVSRNVQRRCRAYIGLPLIVNLNDKFRDKRLFTNVIIHSANQELIRIAKVELQNDANKSKLTIKSCNRSSVPVAVRPSRPAPWLFQIQASDPNEPPAGETFQLHITYRSLFEDLSSVIERAIDLDEKSSSNQGRQKELRESVKNALFSDNRWVDMLESIRQSSNKIDLTEWVKQLADHAPVKLDFDSLLGAIKGMRLMDSESQLDSPGERSRWRMATMPFDVPLMSIINRVKIVPQLSPGALLYAGQPLDIAVTIESCLHWSGSKEDLESRHIMRYDVLSDMESGWLISGPKRGEYVAENESSHTLTLTLLPLRHGVLALPIVTTEPAEKPSGRHASCETWQANGAQKITVLPRNSRSTYTVAMPIPVM